MSLEFLAIQDDKPRDGWAEIYLRTYGSREQVRATLQAIRGSRTGERIFQLFIKTTPSFEYF